MQLLSNIGLRMEGPLEVHGEGQAMVWHIPGCSSTGFCSICANVNSKCAPFDCLPALKQPLWLQVDVIVCTMACMLEWRRHSNKVMLASFGMLT